MTAAWITRLPARRPAAALVAAFALAFGAGEVLFAAGAARAQGLGLPSQDRKLPVEINADDVKCAHGSTTGQLDENSLFYLLTRGISEVEARQILVQAFAAELLTDIEVDALAEHVQAALADVGGKHG